MRSDFDSVGDFHRKFGLPATQEPRRMTPTLAERTQPRVVDDSTARFRLLFLIEELREIAKGYGVEMNIVLHRIEGAPQDLPAIADGLVDLVYVALGTAHLHGLPWPELFAEVQRANMTKERATGSGDERSTRGHSLDVVKPAGFTPPRIVETLMAAGWPGPALPLGGE